jgi:galactonate dehydratase
MKVTDVAVQLVQSDDGRKWTHVVVSTDEGITGIGEATYSHKELVVAEMVRALSDRVIGRDPFDTEKIYLDLYAHGRAGYRTGGVMFTSAISGIDQALWDIKGKALSAPVSALLGGPREERVPVYSHFGGDTIEARIEDAQRRLAEGFTAVKSGTTEWIAHGPRVTRDELRRIDRAYDQLRSALGDDVELMDDPHAAYDAPSGLEIARVLEKYRLLFLEEPTIPEDLAGYGRIRSGTTTTIAGSERLTSKFRFHDFFQAGAIDVAQPDIVYIGGITEMKKVAAIAELYQVVIAPHNTKGPVGIMASAHVMASIPNALIQEFITPTWIPWRNDVLADPLDVVDGQLLVRDRPGLGISFDEDALRPHLLLR